MKKSFKSLMIFFALFAIFVPTAFVLAAVDAGVGTVDSSIALSNASPLAIAAKVINFALIFLGIIAVSLVIYGGFIWMTSNGRAEKIEIAQKILKNSLIGLVIVLSSWGITAFVFAKLLGNGSGGGVNTEDPTNYQTSQFGLGAAGSCVVESFYPSSQKSGVPRNTSIMVTFKDEVRADTICRNNNHESCSCSTTCNKLNLAAIQIFQKSIGNGCSTTVLGNGNVDCGLGTTNLQNATVALSWDKKTIVITPQEYLGEANVSVDYVVRLTNNIFNSRGTRMFDDCSPKYLEWGFSVNGLVDLQPPIVINKGVFPPADNERDSSVLQDGQSAVSTIQVKRALVPAKEVDFTVVRGGGTTANISALTLSNNYQETSAAASDIFKLVAFDSATTFQLSSGGKLLGSAQVAKVGGENLVNFPNYFSFKIGTFNAGNSWDITVGKPYPADRIMVGTYNLNFPSPADPVTAATKIVTFLSGTGLFKTVTRSNTTVTIIAKPGNQSASLNISSVRPDAVLITPFSGGTDGGTVVSIKDKPDQPMNSAIQINFSKEMNPLTITGPSNYVSSSIYIINSGDASSECETTETSGSQEEIAQNKSLLAQKEIELNSLLDLKFVDDSVAVIPDGMMQWWLFGWKNALEEEIKSMKEQDNPELYQQKKEEVELIIKDLEQFDAREVLTRWLKNRETQLVEQIASGNFKEQESALEVELQQVRDDLTNVNAEEIILRWQNEKIKKLEKEIQSKEVQENPELLSQKNIELKVAIRDLDYAWSPIKEWMDNKISILKEEISVLNKKITALEKPIINSNCSSQNLGSNGDSCSQDNDCLSYKCANNKCVGDFLSGKFTMSSDYKTLEFLSDEKCGMNGCGGEIFCLPSKAHLKVIMIAADLQQCQGDSDCGTKSPFNNCSPLLAYNACANPSGNFYPTADISSLKGIFDASGNSFSGNRDLFANGPVSIFNENVSGSLGADNFSWSFFINDQMIITAPEISSVWPSNAASGIDLSLPILLDFNRLMLNSSLRTGSKIINNGNGDITHNFLNIRSFGDPAGYWISSSNRSNSDNGILDQTNIQMHHSIFSKSSSFNAQVGSGVLDIYQNCFKPSSGVGCSASDAASSCCLGIATSTAGLDEAGNCK